MTALASHLVKAGLRTAINASPEPVTNIAVSTGEDVAVSGVVALAGAHPWWSAGLAFALLGLVGFLTGVTGLGLVATGLALVAALLNAAFRFCLGCELYLIARRALPARA